MSPRGVKQIWIDIAKEIQKVEEEKKRESLEKLGMGENRYVWKEEQDDNKGRMK